MTPAQIIEICQAIERGEKLECKSSNPSGVWYTFDKTKHSLEFYDKKWRIAKLEPKKVKLYSYIDKVSGVLLFKPDTRPRCEVYRAPQFDTEVEE